MTLSPDNAFPSPTGNHDHDADVPIEPTAAINGHDISEPEPAHEAYAARDPRAGHCIAEHKVGLTLLATAAPGKCWRPSFALPQIAAIIRGPLIVDGMPLTGLTLSEGRTFAGIVAAHRGGAISAKQAAEILQARNVRGIVYVHPDEDGWRVLIPLSQSREVKEIEPHGENEPKRPRRWIEVFELFAARVNGLFDGKLDPDVFESGLVLPIGSVRDLKVVPGEFLDRNDRTYRTSIFRDGSTIASRAAVAAANKPKRGEQAKASEILDITELSPDKGEFPGKQIDRNNFIEPYPDVTWWRQNVAYVPATIAALYDYLRDARTRKIILIRGSPANPERQPTRRWKAHQEDRGDHGFDEAPSRLLFFDIDGVEGNWRADPEAAVRCIREQLGEPFASAKCVWFFSGSHGLETVSVATGRVDAKSGKAIKKKRWTDNIIDGSIRVRLAFITDRALSEREAIEFTKVTRELSGVPLDDAISRRVQPNYIARIRWSAHPGRDPLGDIKTIGWCEGANETVAVPDNLPQKARWARAQGHGGEIANHPDAEAAVRGIGSDGRIRQHMTSAIVHLFKLNPVPAGASAADHAVMLADKLATMIGDSEAEIRANLEAHKRPFGDVEIYLPDNMADFARWVLQKFGSTTLTGKTIKLACEPRDTKALLERQAIIDRVRFTVQHADNGMTLLIAPTGTYKSTEVRKAAVEYLRANPGKSVVILIPRHDLANEFLRKLHEEHPDLEFNAAIWRGRHRDDPESPDPKHPGKYLPMCHRSKDAKKLEMNLVDVKSHLCRRGRGKSRVECALLPLCGTWRQNATKARLWIGAHELMVHELPKTFGDVGRIFIDEDPTDAFPFGHNDAAPADKVSVKLDTLTSPPRFAADSGWLMQARRALYQALDGIVPPDDEHRGAPATPEILGEFFHSDIAA